MDYSSIFITNLKSKVFLNSSFETKTYNNYIIAYKKELNPHLLFVETDQNIVFAHVNYGCKKMLLALGNEVENVREVNSSILKDFHWGFILIISKTKNEIHLINDIYGVYPIYFINNEAGLIISNEFEGLINTQEKVSLNFHGLYDYFLFNYTIKSRTIINEISQLEGGSLIKFESNVLVVKKRADITNLIFSYKDAGIEEMCRSLTDHIESNTDPDLPVQLPLTGGFDTKVILSILLSKQQKFAAYTFGSVDGDDNIAAQSIANQFGIDQKYIALTSDFLKEIDSQINNYIRFSPNAPMLESLLYYMLVKEKIPKSNIISGVMGGELMVGPVLIAELVTTRTAAMLTLCEDEEDLRIELAKDIEEVGFININRFKENVVEYIEPLKSYIRKNKEDKHKNIVNFLINETYAKFFGVIFINMFSKYNIINPFLDLRFLKSLFNSKYSFTHKRPFRKAPLSHFFSRRLYPKMIRIIEPKVLSAQMDRGYNLRDFLHWYMFPKPIFNYIRRHILKKRKVVSSDLGYIPYLKELLVEKADSLHVIKLDFFDQDKLLYIIEDMKNNKTTKFQEKKLLQVLTINYFLQRYWEKLKL
ncbi:MAG: hypothetical protein AB9846_06115 [Tenuifilaceae bacterium]